MVGTVGHWHAPSSQPAPETIASPARRS
jgi:hypothetical protein